MPIFESTGNTFAPICTNFLNYSRIKISLNFELKLVLLIILNNPNVFFASENCQFYRFFRATVRYLKVVQSCSYLMSSMISIPTLWTKSIFDVQVTFIIIILGFSKIGPFFLFPKSEAPVPRDSQYMALKVPRCQTFLTSV